MSKNTFDENAQHNQVEHIQANMQDIGMQENRRDKAPVLSCYNRIIIFRSIRNQHISILTICKHVCQYVSQAVCSSGQGDLVSRDTPHYNGDNS